MQNTLIWLLIFFGLMYFLMIRPQQKQKKQREELLNNLEKGDKVVTIGGIHGKIVSLSDDDMILEVAPNTRMTFQRTAVGFVKVEDEDEKKGKKSKAKQEKVEKIEEPAEAEPEEKEE